MIKAKDDICPRCGGDVPNTLSKGVYQGALSRFADFEICSACGTAEALQDFVGRPPIPDDEWFIRSGVRRLPQGPAS